MTMPPDTSSATSRYVGQGLKRREDPKYLTGQSHYTDDLAPSGTLHAAIVRSPYAHARIVGIHVEKARSSPGVVAVYTGADVRGRLATLPCTWILPGMKVPVHPVLAFDTVRYAGDGVAVIVAEDRYAAADALDVIEVDYEPLEAVTNQEHEMRPGAAILHDNVPQNVAVVWHTGKGDFTLAGASADVHLKQRLINQPLLPAALEPRAVLAQYTPVTEELVLFTSTQAPHQVRRLLSETINIPEHKVRVIAPDVGGGFGSKLHFYAEVDTQTGEITIERFVAVDDCGNIINPLLVAGQVHGGIAQGIGQALFEGAEYDEQGQLLTGTLMDYALPRAADLPTFETDHTVTLTPVNALGVNAVVDALTPFGIRHLDMPLSVEKVWRAIQSAAEH